MWGLGHSVNFNGRYSTLDRRASLSYSAPRFRNVEGRNITVTGLYDNTRDVLTFTAVKLQGAVQVSQRVDKATNLLFRYTWTDDRVDQNTLKISPLLIPLYSQPSRVGLFAVNLVQDRRDDPADAHRGIYNSLDLGLADPTTSAATRTSCASWARNSYYKKLVGNFVLASNTEFGVIRPFSTGGIADHANTFRCPSAFSAAAKPRMRGFPMNQAGPRDPETGFPLGGNALLFHSTELRFPLIGDNISGVLFHDMGNVYSGLGSISFRVHQKGPHGFRLHGARRGFRDSLPNAAGPASGGSGLQHQSAHVQRLAGHLSAASLRRRHQDRPKRQSLSVLLLDRAGFLICDGMLTFAVSAVVLCCLTCVAAVVDRVAVVIDKKVITESEVLDELRLTEFLNNQPWTWARRPAAQPPNAWWTRNSSAGKWRSAATPSPPPARPMRCSANSGRSASIPLAEYRAALGKVRHHRGPVESSACSGNSPPFASPISASVPNSPRPAPNPPTAPLAGAAATSVDQQMDAWLKAGPRQLQDHIQAGGIPMTRGRRIAAIVGRVAGGAGGRCCCSPAIVIVQTDWFRNMVREKIVTAVEDATGGKVDIASFGFDWRHLRAQVRGFVIHGLEPATAAPLLRANLVQVDLKLLSPFKGFVDIAYLLVDTPQANIIVYPDGHTNIPAPKIQPKSNDKTGLETIVDLAIGRFDLRNGVADFRRPQVRSSMPAARTCAPNWDTTR